MDRERLTEFVRGDYARVVAALGYATGDPARAEDAVQEALAIAWEHDGPIHDLAPWVARTALNRVRTRVRRLGAERRAYERAARLDGAAPADGPVLADRSLQKALARLSPRQREIVGLHYLLDLSVDDVAEVLGVSSGTVKTQLHRARRALRAHLGAEAAAEEADHVG